MLAASRGLLLTSALALVGSACSEGATTDEPSGPTSSGAGAGSSSAGSGAGGSGPTSGPGGSGAGGATGGSGGGGPAGEVRIIAIGDTGEGNAEQHCVADAMSAKCQQDGCDAVVMLGDNFYRDGGNNGGVTSTSDPYWVTHFEQPYDRPGLEGLKFYAVLGNHDYSPPPLDTILQSDGEKQPQIDYSYLPVGAGPGQRLSDKWTMPEAYYDVELGGGLLHLFGLDAQDTSNTQLNDMQGRVSSSTATWKVVFAHHPRYTSGDHALDMPLLNTVTGFSPPSMYELFQGTYCNADIFLSGHDHNREYIAAGQDSSCPNTHFIISGAGAKTRSSSAPTVSGSQYYDDDIEGFFYLTFTPSELVIESYDMNPSDCGGAGLAAPAFARTIAK